MDDLGGGGGEWSEWRRLVLQELRRLDEYMKAADERSRANELEIKVMWAKVSLIATLAALAASFVFRLLTS